jgi:hypothetical protein
MRAHFLALLVTLEVLACGCAADDEGGTPPSISDLSLSPTSLSTGQQNVVTGTFAFEDDDADVLELDVDLELPDGTRQSLPATDVQDSAGDAVGTITLTLAIVPPSPGRYTFQLWLVDAAGGESNRLEGVAQAD